MDRFPLPLPETVNIRAGFLLIAIALTGCDTLPLAGPHETITRNVVYARRGSKDLHVDLYVPKASRPAPLVVWLHGGAWKYGDKSFIIRVRRLTSYGFAVASVQYRRSWEAQWPAQRNDCADALRWLRSHGSEYGIDAQRMGLCGDSSGGHIAALLGVQEGRPRIKAVCALYPPTDMVALGEHYAKYHDNLVEQLFGGPLSQKRAIASDASPVNHVTHNAPPFLFLHGAKDIIVPIAQSRVLDARLRRMGVESHLDEFPKLPHGFGLGETMLAEVASFFHKHLDP